MPHALVIGAGVFGVWTAHFLRDAGWRVSLLDSYGPGNSRSSSGDESRILRCGYGGEERYSHFARRALHLWREFERRAGHADAPIWHPAGVLWLSQPGDPYVQATRATLERGGFPLEILGADALQSRYPQVAASDLAPALFEPEGGVLAARRAVRLMAVDLERRGVTIVRAQADGPMGGSRSVRALRAGAADIAADVFVFACGAWLPKVFPDLLAGRIRPTRQAVVYFGVPAGDDRFDAARLPAWVDFQSGVYGVPDIDGRGLKVGIDAHGPPADPDRQERTIDPQTMATARAWLARRLPAMADAPVVETRVCQYENTSSGDFLIDRHPEHDNVWIVGGGSGHGFKHGPAVGEYASRLILGDVDRIEQFALAGKTARAERAVF